MDHSTKTKRKIIRIVLACTLVNVFYIRSYKTRTVFNSERHQNGSWNLTAQKGIQIEQNVKEKLIDGKDDETINSIIATDQAGMLMMGRHLENNYLQKETETSNSAASLTSRTDHTDNYDVVNLQCSKADELPNGWCLTYDRVPRYVGSGTANPVIISYHTHQGYIKCLANKTIVFIGDSRVRYQYMNLAAYIKNKRFMECSDRSTYKTIANRSKEEDECRLINEKLYSDEWNEWFKLTTKMLSSNTQKHLCDCYSPQGPVELKRENRFTKQWTQYGVIELVFLLNFVNEIHISKQFPPVSTYSSLQERCGPGECSSETVYTGDLTATLNTTLPSICPEKGECHAFVNLGWDFKFGFDQQSKLSCWMEEYMKEHPQIKLYIITSPEDRWRPARSYFDESKLKCKVGVLDRNTPSKGVPKTWYWDYFHVYSILNEQFNHQMVKMICPLD